MAADRDIKPGPVPEDVLRYLRRKGLRVGFHYADVWQEEHHASFTAAKHMRTDVLAALQDELLKAIDAGVPFERFKRDIQPRMESLGWWKPQDVTDPDTGETVRVNPPARLQTIYQTNMRVARAVGQYERVQRTKAARPFLLWQLGPSEQHRPEHIKLHGLMLPVDDPFWVNMWPPTAYGCKCGLRTLSAREAGRLEREGVLAPSAEPILDDEGNPTGHVRNRRIPVQTEAPKLPLVAWKNPRTGAVEYAPEGVHPSFDRPIASARKVDPKAGQ